MAYLYKALSLFFILTTFQAHAFRFAPIYATLTPDGKGKSTTFTIDNTQKEKIAVQIAMQNRQEDIDGVETNTPAKELFNIFPEQLILEPGQSRKIRLTWLGKDIPAKELPFRLVAEQLDVKGLEAKAAKTGGKIKILMAYRASVYVEPPKVAPDVVIESTAVDTSGKEPSLKIVFHNQGNKHQLLLTPVLTFDYKDKAGKDNSVKLEGKAVELINENNVLPGGKRQFSIPWNAPIPEGTMKAGFKVKSED